MLPPEQPDRVHVPYDDDRLVVNAGQEKSALAHR